MNKFKYSRVEWIGNIPFDWMVCKAKYLMKTPVQTGAGASAEEYDLNKVRYIRISDFDKNGNIDDTVKASIPKDVGDKYLLNDGDVLVATAGGTVGKAMLFKDIGEPCAYAGYLARYVTDRDKLDPKFLLYYLQSPLFDNFRACAVLKATIENISASRYANMEVVVPPINIQKNIKNKLDKISTKLDLIINSQQSEIEILKDYKKALIIELVNNGLNKRAEMTKSKIDYLLPYPKHWRLLRGKNILKILDRPVMPDDGVVTCFRDGEVTLRSNRREEGFTFADKEIGYQGIEAGDLVIHGMDGFAGAIGISTDRGKGSPVLSVCDSTENKKFIMYYLRSLAYRDVILALSTGIRVRSCDLRWNKVANLLYPIPPRSEQDKIVEELEQKCSKIDQLILLKQKKIDILTNYKKSVIFEYITGLKDINQEVSYGN